jgi:hypothetical protein
MDNNLQPNSFENKRNDYYQAVLDAARRVWANKFLWFWGVLLPSGLIIGNSQSGSEENESVDLDILFFQWRQFWIDNSTWIITSLILFFFLIIVFWLLSSIARGGVINILNELQEIDTKKQEKVNQKEYFKRVWKIGKIKFKDIMKLDLLFLLIFLALITAAGLPLFFAYERHNPTTLSLVITLAILIFIPLSLIISFTKSTSLIYVALINEKPSRSIEHGYNLLMKNKKETLKLILTFLILTSLIGIFLAMILTVILSILSYFVFLNPTFFDFSRESINIFGAIIIGLFSLAIILWIKSFNALWSQDIWLWWVKKISSIKIDQKENAISISSKNIQEEKPQIITEEKTK